MSDIGVLLVNLGTPAALTPQAIRHFLNEFLSDQRVVSLPRWLWKPILLGVILPFRSRSLVEKYEKIWLPKGSPLSVYGFSLEEKLRQELSDNIHVRFAMRYGSPSVSERLQEFYQLKVKKIMVIPMYPQFSASTTSSIYDVISSELQKWASIPELHFISNYHDHPYYIKAIVDQIRLHWAEKGKAEKLVFSYHGLPVRSINQGDPYKMHCEKTTDLIVKELGLEKEAWELVYQSRFGKETWIQPYCDKTLQSLPAVGCQSVDIICPGFSADCLETLEEISIANRDLFMEAGGKQYSYIDALNDSDSQVQLMLQLIQR